VGFKDFGHFLSDLTQILMKPNPTLPGDSLECPEQIMPHIKQIDPQVQKL